MKYKTPLIINEFPTLENVTGYRKNKLFLKVIFPNLIKIYWRSALSEAQNHRCCWCSCKMTEYRDKSNSATIEHVIPKSCGGIDHPDNYAISCCKCNKKRGNIAVDDFIKILRKEEKKKVSSGKLFYWGA